VSDSTARIVGGSDGQRPGLELTLGVEEEFHLVDLETRRLVARAPELLASLPAGAYAAELQRCVVESNTEVVSDLDGLRWELTRLRRGIVDAAERLGIGVVAAGTVPLSLPAELDVTDSLRYRRMLADYQLLAREQLICGLQVHVGVSDRDLAVAVSRRIEPYLPLLLALSASSPFWSGGIDTGYASVRSLVWQRWPTAGQAGPVSSAAEYDELVDKLVATGVITDSGMVYFDTRPSAHLLTLELRVCDATPLVDDAVLVAGLFRALVLREARAHLDGDPVAHLSAPVHRAAMWRAARSGIEGDLLDFPLCRPVTAALLVGQTVDRLRAELEALGDWEQIQHLSEMACRRDGSPVRQRGALGRRGSLYDVVDLLLAETRGVATGSLPSRSSLTRPPRPGLRRGSERPSGTPSATLSPQGPTATAT
jgi:carboxylate-amine ligase